jgi:hypothetical protein
MKIALWRYGMSMQTDAQSTVGGGLLANATIRTLVAQGHSVDVVGPIAKGLDVRQLGAQHRPTLDIGRYGTAVILTGPFNPLYGDAAFDTYRRLATFAGPVAYAQWDVALPFHFNAMDRPKVAAIAKVTQTDVHRDKRWFVLSQTAEQHLRASGSASVGYATTQFTHVPCLFELEELNRPALAPHPGPIPAIGYFGSDRPGRIAEVVRLLAAPGAPPSHLYGRWSAKSLHAISAPAGTAAPIGYCGMVPEAQVACTLNTYACTLYLADPAYIKTDFIAQRFFENVTAGVPVLYSDKLQPSVRGAIAPEWVCESPAALADKFAQLGSLTPRMRAKRVRDHAAAVQAFSHKRTDTLAHALAAVCK